MAGPTPIRLRLAALFATGTALVVGVGGAVFVNELSGGLTNSLATAIESRAALIVSASRTHPAVALEASKPLANASTFAQVLSPTGAVRSSSGSEARGALVTAATLTHLPTHGVLLPHNLRGGDNALLFIERMPGRDSVLVVGTSLQTVDEALDNIEASLLIGGPIAVLLAAIASYLLAGAALRPVERMRGQAAAISEHDETSSLDVPRTDDELAALARTLNDLLARLQGALGRQRGFVSAAGHELRTPLANLKLELELARRPGRTPDDLSAAIAAATDEVERLAIIAERLLLLAQFDERAELIVRRHVDIVPVLASAIESFRGIARQRGVHLELATGESSIEANVDDVALRQIVGNLLDNALRYAPAESTVEVTVHRGLLPGRTAGSLAIEVADRGPGFPLEFLPRALERFSRPDAGRDREGGGVGLGLAIVKSLVEAHDGDVLVGNRPGGGAIVEVRLPFDEAPPSPTPTSNEVTATS